MPRPSGRFPAGAALALLVLLGSARGASAQLRVAAASDLQPVLPAIASRFERITGQRLQISYGSSGQFVAQIQNGAPFDVFLSADETYVSRLVGAGLGETSSVTTYATGRLALWSRTDRRLNLASGLAALSNPAIRRIAIANPEHAPYGRAAVDALRRAGLDKALDSRLVLGENVAQAAQFAQTGNADVAIVALSLTLTGPMQRTGSAVEVPADSFAPIRQTGVVISRSTSKDLARRFLAFLVQPDTTALLQASGFGGVR